MQPTWESNMGDEKSQLLDISPFTPNGNRISPPRSAFQGRTGQVTEKCGLSNGQNIYLKPPLQSCSSEAVRSS